MSTFTAQHDKRYTTRAMLTNKQFVIPPGVIHNERLQRVDGSNADKSGEGVTERQENSYCLQQGFFCKDIGAGTK